jgi:molybdenum cofactor cytidylyltransferase
MEPVAALVLCAGEGRRLGLGCKGLLALGGVALVCRQVAALLEAGVDAVHVVTGHQSEQVATALRGWPVRLVHNPDWRSGHTTSVLCGLQHLPPAHSALITVVDLPWLSSVHHRAALHTWHSRSATTHMLSPVHQGQPAHPVLIDSAVVQACVQHRLPPRGWMRQYPTLCSEWDTRDAAHVQDIDTPSDWAACLQQWPSSPGGA